MKKSNEISSCPVCGHGGIGEYDICPVCNWENDPVQAYNPNLEGGANQMSLEQAKQAYKSGQPIQ